MMATTIAGATQLSKSGSSPFNPPAEVNKARYLRKLQQAQATVAAPSVSAKHHDTVLSNSSLPTHQSLTSLPQPASRPIHIQGQLTAVEQLSVPPLSSTVPTSPYSLMADTSPNHYHGLSSIPSQGSYSGSVSSDHTDNHSTVGYGSPHHLSSPVPILPPTCFPPLSYYCHPHRLEDIAPRDTIYLIIALFFDFVYPLTPCIHKPSFMADLHARREERDPLFFALVMSTVASTLVQVPRSYVPMERSTVKKLARTCHEASRHITVASYDPPSSTHVVIRYLTITTEETGAYGVWFYRQPRAEWLYGCGMSVHGVQEYYGGVGFRQATLGVVKDFFDNPKASRANALNPFLVMQANVYVTQQLVRFVIEQYRDELITFMRGSIDEQQAAADREAVASDLLDILHSIPIQSIATNGPSLTLQVHKVRFVASTLLDEVRKADSAPASAARAHAYLWDFLSILSEIEKNYMLEDDTDRGSAPDDKVGVL
ncbi:hypothetical protein ID866_1433 [Astraeus odoratus]|nr:hypothetical protein ID866_1433 [Astraeus odoratus]